MIINKNDKFTTLQVSSCLKNGGIVILPTDTVYGFSGIVDLRSEGINYFTDKKIRSIKGRTETKPLIQLIGQPEDIFLYTDEKIPESLLEKWPGPLTIIVPIKINSPFAENFKTVGFRCPGDKWLRTIIQEAGAPIFSTSVNKSGCPILETVQDIREQFEKNVDIIVEDGNKEGGVPSTLVSIINDEIKIIRQGAIKI